jgi:NAD/NADP transhydrogenase beta subunit
VPRGVRAGRDGVHDRGRVGQLLRLPVTFAKLQELITTRPVIFTGLPVAFGGGLLVAVVLSVIIVLEPSLALGIVLALLGLAIGLLLVLPVGGADVPIVISLLNAFTGLTVAAGGYCCRTRCCWWAARSSVPPARS